ncbi:retrovirus-related pol polyprotein from transposon TNT 1-94 [Tanacetum coccineum]
MEQVITKKVWNLMRVIFFMLKKGISKAKIMADLNMMIKRGKIAGKPTSSSNEYEFSCNNTPPYPLSLFSYHKRHQNNRTYSSNSNPPLAVQDSDDIVINSAVLKALEKMTIKAMSTPLPAFGESPFQGANSREDGHVDEAADKFIRRFYNDLRLEN